MPSLPPETERLWKRLENEPLLQGWYLIGGTALSLTIGHRQSEDLDFAWPGTKLPAQRLASLVSHLESEGWILERTDDPGSFDEFLIAGMDLHDYQQDFLASSNDGAVKLTFFSPDPPLSRLLSPTQSLRVIIPPLPLLFQSKALVVSRRSTCRDFVDLYILMTQFHFTMDDFAAAFVAAEAVGEMDLAFIRLTSGRFRAGDPGVAGLMADPPSPGALTEFFSRMIADWKRRRANEALQISDVKTGDSAT